MAQWARIDPADPVRSLAPADIAAAVRLIQEHRLGLPTARAIAATAPVLWDPGPDDCAWPGQASTDGTAGA